MSDISLHWSIVDIAVILLVMGSPGLLIGALVGVFGWRRHRVWGAVLGAVAGFALCLLGWYLYIQL